MIDIDISKVNKQALRILEDLESAGYDAYLVGGCLRDLLLGYVPKDIDIATNALPEEAQKAIRRSRVIGRRFKLVLAHRGVEQYEISTFRRNAYLDEEPSDHPQGDNIYGTLEEDAWRRDYTFNALFYNPQSKKFFDPTGGLRDIEKRRVQMIGDPDQRLVEDSIRILRAVRHAHKLDCHIPASLRKKFSEHAPELLKSALPRRREEFIKILRVYSPFHCFLDMADLGILEAILPSLHPFFQKKQSLQNIRRCWAQLRKKDRSEMEPTEIFTWILIPCLSALEPDPKKWYELSRHPEWTQLMKEELGMFGYEMTDFTQVCELTPQILEMEQYSKRSEKRQSSFLRHRVWPLALDIMYNLKYLSTSQYSDWVREFKNKL